MDIFVHMEFWSINLGIDWTKSAMVIFQAYK